jgi:predicted RNA binding protein YcfA (HicA-like mRNA interferase family)
MPRLPRISSKEAIRTLERLGFYEARQTGSHVPYEKTFARWGNCLRCTRA